MNYRKDIDGLRSIAVMLVVLYHFGFEKISGGFVGVDVFFVISGFLITTIIYNQLIEKRFSFRTFYLRRIKRIIPVLLFVIVVTSIVFWFVLLPTDLEKLSKSIIWILANLSNFFFWQEYGGYFDGGSQEAPLLHTWSLAVEEQYYFLWPIFLIGAIRFFSRKWLALLLISSLFICIYLSELSTKITIGASYYLLPSRIYELMVGSLLAMYWSQIPNLPRLLNHFISVVGLTMILFSAFYLTKNSSFPGYNALYPTIGAALLILSGKGGVENSGFINRIIMLRPFVFIGLISYSLYLWHWPIAAYINYTNIELTIVSQSMMLVAAIAMSYLSWRFVENKARHFKTQGFIKPMLLYYLLPSFLLVACAFLVLKKEGFPGRFDQNIIAMDEAYRTYPNKLRGSCHSALRNSQDKVNLNDCLLGDGNSSYSALHLGDSHGNHFTGFIDEMGKSDGVKLVDYTLDNCPPVFGMYYGASAFKSERCYQRNKEAERELYSGKYSYVVLAASWPRSGSSSFFENNKRINDVDRKNQIFSEAMQAMFFELEKRNIKPIVITTIPSVLKGKPDCPIKKAMFAPALECQISLESNSMFDDILVELQSQYSFPIVRPEEFMCKDGLCVMSIENIPLYRDADHLNDVASRVLAEKYKLKYKRLFK